MGTTKEVKEYESEALRKSGLRYANGMIWGEFGDQVDTQGISEKQKLTTFGIKHISFDLNGKHGAVKADLDKPLPEKFRGIFDVITNYGTIEHVGNQYVAFKNFNDSTKVGGIMIHGFPLKGFWKNHCRYYYTSEFVEKLAKICNYELIDLRTIDYGYFVGKPMIYATLRKKKEEFINFEEFEKLPIYDSGDTGRTGYYESFTHRLKRKIRFYIKKIRNAISSKKIHQKSIV